MRILNREWTAGLSNETSSEFRNLSDEIENTVIFFGALSVIFDISNQFCCKY